MIRPIGSFGSLLAILVLISCQKETTLDNDFLLPTTEYTEVDEALWSYFEAFEEEGKARGLDVNLTRSGISAEILEIDEDGVAGQCRYHSNMQIPREITIDQTFWNRSNVDLREMIIFHELGHCYLNRGHREDAHENGRCVSIMRSGLGDCFDFYNGITREQYLDELFGVGD